MHSPIIINAKSSVLQKTPGFAMSEHISCTRAGDNAGSAQETNNKFCVANFGIRVIIKMDSVAKIQINFD